VLGNLQKRFDNGPQDWTEWMAKLKAWLDDSTKKAATPK